MKVLLWTDNLLFFKHVQTIFKKASVIAINKKWQLESVFLENTDVVIMNWAYIRKDVELKHIVQIYLQISARIYIFYENSDCDPRLFKILAKTNMIIKRNIPDLPQALDSSYLFFDLKKRAVRKNNKIIYLSPRETEVMQILTQNCDCIVNSEDLLKSIWSGIGSEANVYMTIQKLRSKIEDDPKQPTYLITRKGGGYMLKCCNTSI
ncbi:winged helix-turn-helix domain-containing protein [Paenibacillus graminis]|uniref:winged helix-turn-helix domain-containing protein n=1 Tax=Paenibacillus graminis TaxID=189425 RepID=UPI0004714A21|nr:winged helix-turn-helix domain-containing protein [Paenibacillus graminis]